jgi:hypothetical protein
LTWDPQARAERYGPQHEVYHAGEASRGEKLLAEAALTLVPLGGVVRGARALRWGYHGLRGSRFYRRGKRGFRFRDKKTGRWRSGPPTVRRDLYQAQAHARHGYRRGRQAVDRRLPLRRTRHLIDKWAGRAELVTRPTAYLERRALGRLVPGGVYTVGGVKYVATRLSSSPSKGRGGPSRKTPTHRRRRRPRRQGRAPAEHRKHGGPRRESRRGGRARRKCPPGHYYSFKHRRCLRSRYQ